MNGLPGARPRFETVVGPVVVVVPVVGGVVGVVAFATNTGVPGLLLEVLGEPVPLGKPPVLVPSDALSLTVVVGREASTVGSSLVGGADGSGVLVTTGVPLSDPPELSATGGDEGVTLGLVLVGLPVDGLSQAQLPGSLDGELFAIVGEVSGEPLLDGVPVLDDGALFAIVGEVSGEPPLDGVPVLDDGALLVIVGEVSGEPLLDGVPLLDDGALFVIVGEVSGEPLLDGVPVLDDGALFVIDGEVSGEPLLDGVLVEAGVLLATGVPLVEPVELDDDVPVLDGAASEPYQPPSAIGPSDAGPLAPLLPPVALPPPERPLPPPPDEAKFAPPPEKPSFDASGVPPGVASGPGCGKSPWPAVRSDPLAGCSALRFRATEAAGLPAGLASAIVGNDASVDAGRGLAFAATACAALA